MTTTAKYMYKNHCQSNKIKGENGVNKHRGRGVNHDTPRDVRGIGLTLELHDCTRNRNIRSGSDTAPGTCTRIWQNESSGARGEAAMCGSGAYT